MHAPAARGAMVQTARKLQIVRMLLVPRSCQWSLHTVSLVHNCVDWHRMPWSWGACRACALLPLFYTRVHVRSTCPGTSHSHIHPHQLDVVLFLFM